MTRYRELLPRAVAQHGLLTPDDAVAIGGTAHVLVQLAHRGQLERVGRRIYRVPELAGDPLEQYQEALLRLPAAVLSHDTALDLHDLCDINPIKVHVTIPAATRIRAELPAWLTVHRRDLADGETTWHEGLAIITPARAIIDGIETHVGQRFIDEAREAATRRGLLSTREAQAVERALVAERLHQLNAAAAG
jgi:predicted transcriptional regulator of viral defense system